MDDVTRRQAMMATATAGLVLAGGSAALAAPQDRRHGDEPGGGPFGMNAGTSAGGSTRVALPFLPYSNFQEFVRRSGSAFANDKMTKRKTKFAEDTFRVGALALPDGKAIYANIASSSDTVAEAELAVYTELGADQIVATLEDQRGTHTYRAAIFRDGAELVSIEWKVALVHASNRTINGGGLVTDLRVQSHNDQVVNEVLRSCFESCLRRHAPDCVAICLQFGKAACIACAGGSIACCWINCHC